MAWKDLKSYDMLIIVNTPHTACVLCQLRFILSIYLFHFPVWQTHFQPFKEEVNWKCIKMVPEYTFH